MTYKEKEKKVLTHIYIYGEMATELSDVAEAFRDCGLNDEEVAEEIQKLFDSVSE